MSDKEYYEVLGLERNASDTDIKKAYRQMARSFHPDKNKEEGAEETMKKVTEAYNVLSDPQEKHKYDNGSDEDIFSGGMGGFWQEMARRHAHFEFDDESDDSDDGYYDPFFSRMFFRGPFGPPFFAQRQQPQQYPDMHYAIYVTLEDVYKGCTKRKTITRSVLNFDGWSRRFEDKTFKIKIEKGCKNGTEIKFDQEGSQSTNHMIKSDVIFIIRDDVNPIFTREEENIKYVVKLPLKDAITDLSVNVPTLDKTVVPLTVKPDCVHRIVGQGLPFEDEPSRRGDLIVKFEIKHSEWEEHLSNLALFDSHIKEFDAIYSQSKDCLDNAQKSCQNPSITVAQLTAHCTILSSDSQRSRSDKMQNLVSKIEALSSKVSIARYDNLMSRKGDLKSMNAGGKKCRKKINKIRNLLQDFDGKIEKVDLKLGEFEKKLTDLEKVLNKGSIEEIRGIKSKLKDLLLQLNNEKTALNDVTSTSNNMKSFSLPIQKAKNSNRMYDSLLARCQHSTKVAQQEISKSESFRTEFASISSKLHEINTLLENSQNVIKNPKLSIGQLLEKLVKVPNKEEMERVKVQLDKLIGITPKDQKGLQEKYRNLEWMKGQLGVVWKIRDLSRLSGQFEDKRLSSNDVLDKVDAKNDPNLPNLKATFAQMEEILNDFVKISKDRKISLPSLTIGAEIDQMTENLKNLRVKYDEIESKLAKSTPKQSAVNCFLSKYDIISKELDEIESDLNQISDTKPEALKTITSRLAGIQKALDEDMSLTPSDLQVLGWPKTQVEEVRKRKNSLDDQCELMFFLS